ncbi:hypothetical protein AMECASPLE_001468 [Ameca splendens]|uniref:Uncharacterized protein n=1 Tax=Ameca splendens TaxID=208324 RepID=A0ABV0Y8Y4_9TELE
MLGVTLSSGSPSGRRFWPHWVLWRLGGFFLLLLLEGAGCLASQSSPSGVHINNNNSNNPSVNIYMSVEEVKKLLALPQTVGTEFFFSLSANPGVY